MAKFPKFPLLFCELVLADFKVSLFGIRWNLRIALSLMFNFSFMLSQII